MVAPSAGVGDFDETFYAADEIAHLSTRAQTLVFGRMPEQHQADTVAKLQPESPQPRPEPAGPRRGTALLVGVLGRLIESPFQDCARQRAGHHLCLALGARPAGPLTPLDVLQAAEEAPFLAIFSLCEECVRQAGRVHAATLVLPKAIGYDD